jgi:rhamnosyltransferase subunit B
MTILLLTIGSHGDVHPFIGLGIALKHRGHRVRVIVNPHFADLVLKAGLELIPLGVAEDFESLLKDPDLWHRRKSFQTVMNTVIDGLRPVYETLLQNYTKGETIIAASSLALGARVAQDQFNLPMATIHLAPAIFRSTIAPPKLPGLYTPDWMPQSIKKLIFAAGDRLVIDRAICPRLNKFRAEFGLPPVRGILKDWWNSPQRVIGLFPDWFAPMQPDWPPQTRLTGFPLFDEQNIRPLPAELADFLAAGTPPIIFSPGSAMHHADDFFRASVAACTKLNRRAILLSGHAGHIPPNLPPTIRYFSYAPFSQVLPKAAAFVHHGGIGTSAQALAAGVPQIVHPFAYDQLDNADRLRRLGVAKVIHPKSYRTTHVAQTLKDLLTDPALPARCAQIARKFAGVDPVAQTCQLIESLALPPQPSAT